jgi:hypothetical protein
MMLQKSAMSASAASQVRRMAAGRIAARPVLPATRINALPEAAEAIASAAPGNAYEACNNLSGSQLMAVITCNTPSVGTCVPCSPVYC